MQQHRAMAHSAPIHPTHDKAYKAAQKARKAMELAKAAYETATSVLSDAATAVSDEAWTALGRPIPAAISNDPRAIAELCGADYVIEQRPVYVQLADRSFVEVPKRTATVRSDTEHVTGIVSDTRFQTAGRGPRDIIATFVKQLADSHLTVSHAASLAAGSRIAVSAKLPEGHSVQVGTETLDQYLTLTTGYDGKHGTKHTISSLRRVSGALLNYPIATQLRRTRIPSSTGILQVSTQVLDYALNRLSGNVSMRTVPRAVEQSARVSKEQRIAFNRMAETKLSPENVMLYFRECLELGNRSIDAMAPHGKAGVSTKARNMLATVLEIHHKAPGSELAKGSLWAAYNSVAYYATHVKTCRDTTGSGVDATRYASNLDGDSATMKVRALLLALSFLIGE